MSSDKELDEKSVIERLSHTRDLSVLRKIENKVDGYDISVSKAALLKIKISRSIMYDPNQKILVQVGVSFALEYNDKLSEDKIAVLEHAFEDFIDGKRSVFDAAQDFNTIIGTTKPLDRIAAIIQTSDVPIPNFSLLQQSGGANRKKTRSWTDYEDQRLLAAIHRYGTDNWLAVANFVGNGRTRAQCSQRWVRGLDPRISKDRWTEEDEKQLQRLVDLYGVKSWTRVASEMGNRSDVQCRYHYKQMQQGNFYEEEPETKISSSGSLPNRLNLSLNFNQSNIPLKEPSPPKRIVLPSISNLLNTQPIPQNEPRMNTSGSFSDLPPLPTQGMSANTSMPTFPKLPALIPRLPNSPDKST